MRGKLCNDHKENVAWNKQLHSCDYFCNGPILFTFDNVGELHYN